MVSLLGPRENRKNKQIQADLRCSFYYTHIPISLGEMILHLYKKAIKCVIYLESVLSKWFRFLKIFGSLQRISFNYLKTHWYGTLHCLPKLDKWIYTKVTKHSATPSEQTVCSAPLSPKGKTRKTRIKATKLGDYETVSRRKEEGWDAAGGTVFSRPERELSSLRQEGRLPLIEYLQNQDI